jgi:hypothetical protein
VTRYAGFFSRHPRAVLAFALAMTLAALFGIGRLDFDDTPRGIIRSGDEAFRELQSVQAQFGADDNDLVLALFADDWFTPANGEILRRAEVAARAIPGVESVQGIASVVELRGGLLPAPLLPGPGASPAAFAAARARAATHPFVGGVLLSDDGKVALVSARLAGGDLTIQQLAPPLDALVALAAELARAPGVDAGVTGIPAFRVVIYETIRRDQMVFTCLGAAVCFLIALSIFRSLRACLVVTTPAVLGALWVTGSIGLVGSRLDLLGSVLPVLCILIAFTDAVHLTLDVQFELAEGRRLDAAIRHALFKLGTPCFLTSITTAIGLGSLALSGVPVVRHFGAQAFFAVLVVFAAVMTTMPLAALAFKPPPRPRPSESGRFGRWFELVTRRPRAVVGVGIAVTLALLGASATLVPENRLTESMPHDQRVFATFRRCERAFGGLLPLYVLVEWPAGSGPYDAGWRDALAEIEEVLLAAPNLSRPLSPLSLLRLVSEDDPARGAARLAVLPDTLVRGLLREDLRRAVVIARLPDLGTQGLRPVLGSVESGLAAVRVRHPELALSLTGTDVVARRTVNRMIRDLAGGLGVAALLIFGVIALEFRSLRMGLVSLVPNVFPLAFVGATLAVLGRPLQIVTAVLFTVLLGLAVDDTIHMLARFRFERERGADPRTAAARAGAAVGAAITATSLVLIAGYSVVFLSEVPTNRLFAALLSLGLVAAWIGDLVLLPALLAWRKGR